MKKQSKDRTQDQTPKNQDHPDQASEKLDVYTRITDRIVADLENGVRPWMKPWSGENAAGRIVRPLRHNGLPYNGVNILILWSEAADRGYSSPIWMTFKQAAELNGNVRKGEKGTLIVYANQFTKTETNEQGEEELHSVPFLKGYSVFNTDQIEGLPEQYYTRAEPVTTPIAERIEQADRFFESTGAKIRNCGGHAFYSAHTDHIQMPPFEAFRDAESHAAVLAHELTHWTKHSSRLARDLGRKKWGDEGYAREELVAELGAAFLCADLGITPELELREDHAAYIASWLQVLKDDKRAIFSAAAHAHRASDYLHNLQKGQTIAEPVSEPETVPPAIPPVTPVPAAEPDAAPVSYVNRVQAERQKRTRRKQQEESLTLDFDFERG